MSALMQTKHVIKCGNTSTHIPGVYKPNLTLHQVFIIDRKVHL